ncbi:hypothetical protein [Zhongshania sp. BJYM1]|uniref:hypothetical protein n=1 Tax=Zhongshania aquatica TaxID=2965069 RepID=UPI0022B49DE5|nr:hypothetical protein [Marortus sp. BJYM1]|tara:strand:+ start:696 stop:941 length:246 start_codon:yes stop_codon:yes gene_type:complete
MSVLNSEKVSKEKKSLSLIETLVQSLSLLFALQNKEGRKKMMDLAEKNPLSIVISGVLAMSIFFTICFLSSQIVLHIVMNK